MKLELKLMYCIGRKLVLCNSKSLNSAIGKTEQGKPLTLSLCD